MSEIVEIEDIAHKFLQRSENAINTECESEMAALTSAVIALALEVRAVKVQLDPLDLISHALRRRDEDDY